MNRAINGEDDGFLSKKAESGIRGAKREKRAKQADQRDCGSLGGR
jgi:hypothetical protein